VKRALYSSGLSEQVLFLIWSMYFSSSSILSKGNPVISITSSLLESWKEGKLEGEIEIAQRMLQKEMIPTFFPAIFPTISPTFTPTLNRLSEPGHLSFSQVAPYKKCGFFIEKCKKIILSLV
jgi:hypothetical protein